MFERAELDIACPQCGQKFKKTVGWLQQNDACACPGCGVEIRFETDELSRGIKGAEKAIGDLAATVKRLNRR
jgi:peptide subunit release factor 1 (eRF1)